MVLSLLLAVLCSSVIARPLGHRHHYHKKEFEESDFASLQAFLLALASDADWCDGQDPSAGACCFAWGSYSVENSADLCLGQAGLVLKTPSDFYLHKGSTATVDIPTGTVGAPKVCETKGQYYLTSPLSPFRGGATDVRISDYTLTKFLSSGTQAFAVMADYKGQVKVVKVFTRYSKADGDLEITADLMRALRDEVCMRTFSKYQNLQLAHVDSFFVDTIPEPEADNAIDIGAYTNEDYCYVASTDEDWETQLEEDLKAQRQIQPTADHAKCHNTVYLTMPLYNKGDLKHFKWPTDSVEHFKLALTFLNDMLTGLYIMQSAGRQHLDIKPDNIFVHEHKGELHAVVADYGQSRLFGVDDKNIVNEDENMLKLSLSKNSADWAAPEVRTQLIDDGPVMKTTLAPIAIASNDVYSAALVFLHMIRTSDTIERDDDTKGYVRKSFRIKPNPTTVGSFWLELSNLLDGMLAQDPAKRFSVLTAKFLTMQLLSMLDVSSDLTKEVGIFKDRYKAILDILKELRDEHGLPTTLEDVKKQYDLFIIDFDECVASQYGPHHSGVLARISKVIRICMMLTQNKMQNKIADAAGTIAALGQNVGIWNSFGKSVLIGFVRENKQLDTDKLMFDIMQVKRLVHKSRSGKFARVLVIDSDTGKHGQIVEGIVKMMAPEAQITLTLDISYEAATSDVRYKNFDVLSLSRGFASGGGFNADNFVDAIGDRILVKSAGNNAKDLTSKVTLTKGLRLENCLDTANDQEHVDAVVSSAIRKKALLLLAVNYRLDLGGPHYCSAVPGASASIQSKSVAALANKVREHDGSETSGTVGSGTSYAAPIVSGISAMLISALRWNMHVALTDDLDADDIGDELYDPDLSNLFRRLGYQALVSGVHVADDPVWNSNEIASSGYRLALKGDRTKFGNGLVSGDRALDLVDNLPALAPLLSKPIRELFLEVVQESGTGGLPLSTADSKVLFRKARQSFVSKVSTYNEENGDDKWIEKVIKKFNNPWFEDLWFWTCVLENSDKIDRTGALCPSSERATLVGDELSLQARINAAKSFKFTLADLALIMSQYESA